jgi:hypothetical protein
MDSASDDGAAFPMINDPNEKESHMTQQILSWNELVSL